MGGPDFPSPLTRGPGTKGDAQANVPYCSSPKKGRGKGGNAPLHRPNKAPFFGKRGKVPCFLTPEKTQPPAKGRGRKVPYHLRLQEENSLFFEWKGAAFTEPLAAAGEQGKGGRFSHVIAGRKIDCSTPGVDFSCEERPYGRRKGMAGWPP